MTMLRIAFPLLIVLVLPTSVLAQSSPPPTTDSTPHAVLHVESPRAAQWVTAISRGANPMASTSCRTPCSLQLVPGPYTILSGTPGRDPNHASIDLPQAGLNLGLRAPRRGMFTLGAILATVGTGILVGGFSATEVLKDNPQWSYGSLVPPALPMGVATLLFGPPILVGGIILMVLNLSGVSDQSVRSSQARSRWSVTPIATATSGGASMTLSF